MKKIILLALLASVFVYFSPNASAAQHHGKSHRHAAHHKHHKHHKHHR